MKIPREPRTPSLSIRFMKPPNSTIQAQPVSIMVAYYLVYCVSTLTLMCETVYSVSIMCWSAMHLSAFVFRVILESHSGHRLVNCYEKKRNVVYGYSVQYRSAAVRFLFSQVNKFKSKFTKLNQFY